jgi:hypothetical protein
MLEPLQIGKRVQLRKKHPCGADEWHIYRVGADIGIRCAGCGRRVILPRPLFLKRVKRILVTEERES